MKTDVLIVGGGLAGLALARRLHASKYDWCLVEARERWGGRILSHTLEGQGYDLGPSWFWPGQPRLAALIKQLDLQQFDQFYQGDLMYQDENGQAHRGQGFASMQGSWRLQGGFASLVNALQSALPAERLHLSSGVSELAHASDQTAPINVQLKNGQYVQAQRVVLALPPRIASQLNFSPALPENILHRLRSIPTWMAGHAKVVATYAKPFWKEQGLSGDAMSRCGPLAEIHDASPQQEGPFALFGFVGTPASYRHGNTEALKSAIREQLGSLFGEMAASPDDLVLKDWAFDKFTATELDQQSPMTHPSYGRPAELEQLWNDRLHFGSTEMGERFGGFLEGALETADGLANVL